MRRTILEEVRQGGGGLLAARFALIDSEAKPGAEPCWHLGFFHPTGDLAEQCDLLNEDLESYGWPHIRPSDAATIAQEVKEARTPELTAFWAHVCLIPNHLPEHEARALVANLYAPLEARYGPLRPAPAAH